MESVFWVAVLLVGYAYLGYGVLAGLLASRRTGPAKAAGIDPEAWAGTGAGAIASLPRVSLVIAAYNEEEVIAQKVLNSLELEYPSDRLEVVVVSDGSTDRTPELAACFPGVRVLHQPERRGKVHALNRVMPLIDSEVVVFSDANAMLNPEALLRLVRHFQDPRVACVAGEKRIKPQERDVSAGEGFYWRYESTLKRWDAQISSVMGAAGELVALRRSAFVPLENDTVLDDFVMSMRLVARGYRVAYEPEAYALEEASPSISEEFKRKARIVAGGWQAVIRLWPLLVPTRPLIWLQYVSHRVLRWVLVPVLLPVILILNLQLAWQGQALYDWTLQVQLALYGAALLGGWLQLRGLRPRILYLPFYFTFLNAAALVGAYRFWTRTQSVTWEKVQRAPRTTSL